MTLLTYAVQTHRTISDLSAMQTFLHAKAKLQTYRMKDLVMTLLVYADQTHRTTNVIWGPDSCLMAPSFRKAEPVACTTVIIAPRLFLPDSEIHVPR